MNDDDVALLWQQFRNSLEDTGNALGLSGYNWQELAVYGVGQLLVTLMIGLLFWLLYVAGCLVVRWLLGRLGYGAGPYRTGRVVLRYLLGLATLVAILAQYGAEDGVIKGMARAGLMALAFYMVWQLLSHGLINRLSRRHLDSSLVQLCKNTLSVSLMALGAITVMAQFGFDVLSIIAGLGIVGIAVGFAAQSTLSNFIAGITLLIERPFRIGDWVCIHGQEGRVVRIALRTTWLRTRDNVFAMIPNDSVATTDIINYSAEGPTRLRIPLHIAYKDSVEQARSVIMPILRAHPRAINNDTLGPRVQLRELADSSVILSAQVWVSAQDVEVKGRITCELLELIKQGLTEAGIEIPFPHLQLHLDEARGLEPVFGRGHAADDATRNH
ncbi:mechanosensitive ion channel family protein [Oceanimonas sp. CHS3-5]|uniref:mechanosensitive ion channel family protein n=1 Tax=Oceanimonas sp. CHS3-5 TaxID=3068186 RepID=UPI00273EA5FF|nr:mechanosensitive ion channel family protein [Oceanimonas sp. CHS3-5]MDP5291982.1 mechanosensitive ion channel family protein [Oceanimonas sp. CHS3-5]